MFSVRWKPTAVDQLAEVWLNAQDHAKVTEAIHEIDQLLASSPESAGESRADTIRVVFMAPLGVFFDVDVAQETVTVLRVWTY